MARPVIFAGKLRHSLVVQSATYGRTSYGSASATWGTKTTIFASIKPLNGREMFAAKQVNADISHEIEMRYLSGLTPKHRFLFGTRIFQIISCINVDELNRKHVVYCKEIV